MARVVSEYTPDRVLASISCMQDQDKDEDEVRGLYRRLLDAWNGQDAVVFGAAFTDDGEQVGFDGSQVAGATAIGEAMTQIFADHRTARYVALVRSVRFVGADVALLRAEVGMVPPDGNDLVPGRNAVQSMVAMRTTNGWRIALFHNTPAQFDGRPEAVEALTSELRTEWNQNR
jgi:uncharacterized protein (TIGR02246 family)